MFVHLGILALNELNRTDGAWKLSSENIVRSNFLSRRAYNRSHDALELINTLITTIYPKWSAVPK